MPYSHRIKESVLRKLLPPNNRSIREVAQETGITEKTIYNWKKMADDVSMSKGPSKEPTKEPSKEPSREASSPTRLNRLEKFHLLLESKEYNEDTIGKWLRAKGLDSRHLDLWEREFQDIMNKDREK